MREVGVLEAKTRPSALLDEVEAGDEVAIVRREPGPARESVAFALAAKVSLFDAAYLSLAVELDAELATRDGALAEAARRYGVPTHDLRDDR